MSAPDVKILAVGPRDGLQFETQFVSVDARLQFIDMLYNAGHRLIEAGSFVHKSVKSMVGTNEVAAILKQRQAKGMYKDAIFSFLTPNWRGMKNAITAGIGADFGEVAVVIGMSDEFNHNNLGIPRKTEDTKTFIFERMFKPVFKQAKEVGVKVRCYISTVFQEPEIEGPEGAICPVAVAKMAKKMLDTDYVDHVALGDTTGDGTPERTAALITALKAEGITLDKVAMHFHDSNKGVMANVAKAYEMGIRAFDTASGGLGGCKFASMNANLAIEDFIIFAKEQGINTGIDEKKQLAASTFILAAVDRERSSSEGHKKLVDEHGLPHTARLEGRKAKETQQALEGANVDGAELG